MKWPMELLLVRHAESAYNAQKRKKKVDPEYVRFRALLKSNPSDPELQSLARTLRKRHFLGYSDWEMPITPRGELQARITGRKLRESETSPPDVIFVSPYVRTEQTFALMQEEWPALKESTAYREERIREKDIGLALLYNDWPLYVQAHPGQGELETLLGQYHYRPLNGENIPDVRLRNLSWISTLTREFPGKRVMAITHHLTILATRANFERLGQEEFLRLDHREKPVNCGVTRYVGRPELGSQGHLVLQEYNHQYYPDDME